jgi:hypothetical protein
VTKYIKDEVDSGGDSRFFEDSVDVVPDRMFLHLKPLSDFAVLHAVGDEADRIFLATRQQWHSLGIIYMKRLETGKSFDEMFEIFVTGPDLPLMNRLDAFREGLDPRSPVENGSVK